MLCNPTKAETNTTRNGEGFEGREAETLLDRVGHQVERCIRLSYGLRQLKQARK